MGGREDPARGDDGAPAEVVALELQADLPGPLPRGRRVAPHDPRPVAGPSPTGCQEAKVTAQRGIPALVWVTFSPFSPSSGTIPIPTVTSQDVTAPRGFSCSLPCLQHHSRSGGCGAHVSLPCRCSAQLSSKTPLLCPPSSSASHTGRLKHLLSPRDDFAVVF